jgi:predicted N-acyltransferase
MAYSFKIYDAITRCPLEDWNHVCRSVGAGIFMNPGFVSVVETAFARESRFWHLVFYNEQAVPVACASICTFSVDLLTLASTRVRKAVQMVRCYFPGCGKTKMLLCGLPVSLGQNHLAIKPNTDQDQVLQLLDQVLATDLAQREKARLIVYKEFDAVTCEALTPLVAACYYRAEAPPLYLFQVQHKDFSDYCEALNSHYRNDIRRSQRKFERAGLVAAHLHDPEEILRLYDDNVHRLYEAVVEKSNLKLETLPIQFFHGLVKQFPGQLSLTVVRRENRVVAFNWGLHDRRVFYFVFCGIDYGENAQADLYFNLMYHQLDYALGCGPEYISVGQTADSFKSRLGCRPRPLYFYVRGVGPLFSTLIGKFAWVLLPKRPAVAEYSIFKTKSAPAREPKLNPRRPQQLGCEEYEQRPPG